MKEQYRHPGINTTHISRKKKYRCFFEQYLGIETSLSQYRVYVSLISTCSPFCRILSMRFSWFSLFLYNLTSLLWNPLVSSGYKLLSRRKIKRRRKNEPELWNFSSTGCGVGDKFCLVFIYGCVHLWIYRYQIYWFSHLSLLQISFAFLQVDFHLYKFRGISPSIYKIFYTFVI